MPYAKGCVFTESDLREFMGLAGKYSPVAEDSMLLRAVLMASLSQHTEFNPPGLGAPQVHSQTVKALCTNKGAWQAADESFCEFLQRIDPSAGESNERLEAARDVKVRPHFDTLQKGSTELGFAAAQELLMDCARVALTAAIGAAAARASEAEEEEERRAERERDETEAAGVRLVPELDVTDDREDADLLLDAIAEEEEGRAPEEGQDSMF